MSTVQTNVIKTLQHLYPSTLTFFLTIQETGVTLSLYLCKCTNIVTLADSKILFYAIYCKYYEQISKIILSLVSTQQTY